MKKWLILILLITSIILNIYQFGTISLAGMYTPNEKDRVILGEMTQLVVESDDYQKLAEKEKIHAIDTFVDRNKGGVYPFHYDVTVRTDKESYIFSCTDKKCSEVEIGGWTYSIYSESEPVLPLKK